MIFISLSKYLSCWHWNLNSYMYSFSYQNLSAWYNKCCNHVCRSKDEILKLEHCTKECECASLIHENKLTSHNYFQCLNAFSGNPVLQVLELQAK